MLYLQAFSFITQSYYGAIKKAIGDLVLNRCALFKFENNRKDAIVLSVY